MTSASMPGLRLSFMYAGLFVAVGIHLPFWPVWLESRGLGPAEIGAVLAATLWARMVASPVAAHVVDRTGQRKTAMLALAAASLALFALCGVVEGFWPLLVVNTLAGAAFAAMMPLSDSLTLLIAYSRRLDYGRIRLWGSITFIGASVVGGGLLLARPPVMILWALLAGLVATLVACLFLPATAHDHGPTAGKPFRGLLRHRLFRLFLVTGCLIQASHSVYYGFATLHWQRAGLSGNVIGALWAEAVIAEVVLFAFSNRVVARVGPAGLMLIGGLCAVVRWMVIGLGTSLPVLAAEQLLHAATFGATHLGAMHFIVRAAPPGTSARAQAMYSSVAMGATLGLAMLASGRLYEAFGSGAFLASAALAAIGSGAAAVLARAWNGGRLAGEEAA